MMTWWRMGFEQLEYILRKGSKPLKQRAHGQFYTVEQEIHVLIDQNLLSGRKSSFSHTNARQWMVPNGHRTLIFCNSDCFV